MSVTTNGLPGDGTFATVNGAPAGGAGATTTDPTFVEAATDTAINGADITMTPAAITLGDLLVIVIGSGDDSLADDLFTRNAAFMEAGGVFSSYHAHTNPGIRELAAAVFIKVADATDVANGFVTITGTGDVPDAAAGCLLRFTGQDVGSIPNTEFDEVTASLSYTCTSISTGTASGIAICAAAINEAVVITVPGTLTSDAVLSATDTNPVALGVGHKSVAGGGLTGAETFTSGTLSEGIMFTTIVRGVQS